MNRLLLHCCCAPCAVVPSEIIALEDYSVALIYTNASIFPFQEYEHRRDVVRTYAQSRGLVLLEDAVQEADFYAEWEAVVGSLGGPYPLLDDDLAFQQNLAKRQDRCRQCYRLRLRAAARRASKEGYSHLATTLTISPYQFTAIIAEELSLAAAQAGIKAYVRDFREYYPETTRLSRLQGMYRQNYCGCRHSQEEATIEREARRKKKHKTTKRTGES